MARVSSSAGELAPVEDVGERLALARRAQHLRRVALDLLVLEQEAEEAFMPRRRALGSTAPAAGLPRR
jgi:hypothetical protein